MKTQRTIQNHGHENIRNTKIQMKNMQHTIENQETHYIHAKKISNKQETPYEIQETHSNFQETIIMSKKILQNPRKYI